MTHSVDKSSPSDQFPYDTDSLEDQWVVEDRAFKSFGDHFGEIRDLACHIHRVLCRQMVVPKDAPAECMVAGILVGQAVRSFDAGFGLIMRGRTWESQPFERQIVEAVAYMATVIHESDSAELWLRKGERGFEKKQFKAQFDLGKEGAKHRYRHINDVRKEYFESRYNSSSESTHNNLKRAPSAIKVNNEVQEFHLFDLDQHHIGLMALHFCDLGVKTALEVEHQWRHLDPKRAEDSKLALLETQRTVYLDKYKDLNPSGEYMYGILTSGEFGRRRKTSS